MSSQVKSNQRGAVSMITVIFISILLTIMTASFIRLAINEQREATDDDLTTRAFYAAESGIEDAIAAIETKGVDALDNPTDCAPEGVAADRNDLSTTLDTEYTCQLIDTQPPNYQASLSENESAFFKLESSSSALNINSFTLKWFYYGDGVDSDGDVYALRNTDSLSNNDDWKSGNYPAMMRVQVISIPGAGNINRDDIENNVSFLNPNVGSSNSPTVLGPLFDATVLNATCKDPTAIASGQYACSFEVIGLDDATKDYYIRLTPIYRSTYLLLTANSGATPVNLLNAQAVIDVTGRAGDVYRRVEKRINLHNDSLWPNFAILSGEDICKNFVITDDANEFSTLNSGISPGSCQ